MAALEAPHVVLFKPTDLRLHDHAALLAAHEAASVVHLLVLDPRLGFGPGAAPSREAGLARIEGKRATFLAESVADLHAALRRRGYELLVYRGPAEAAVAAVAAAVARRGDARAVVVHAHGPELCTEERAVERRVAAVADLRLHWGWTLNFIAVLFRSI